MNEIKTIVNAETRLSFSEKLTVSILYETEKEMTCQEIRQRFLERYGVDYKDTTMYTFLKNLKEKGYITSYKRGVTFYTVAVPRNEFIQREMEEVVSIIFEGDKEAAVKFMQSM